MPNAIKYNVSAETLALKKGNFWIGTGDVGKGPTSSTGYYNGITPPSGGYTIYLNKASGGPSIYTVTTEAQMVSLTNSIGSQSFTTSGQCLNWFATQTDKMIFNIDYSGIVTNGLVLNVDAGFTPSYPTINTTWYDVSSSGNNGTLTNGPTFNSANNGSIVFDGVDDYVAVSRTLSTSNYSAEFMFKADVNTLGTEHWLGSQYPGTGRVIFDLWTNNTLRNFCNGTGILGATIIETGTWYHAVFTRNSSGVAYIYLNGVQDATGTIPSATPVNAPFLIAGTTALTGRWFNGKIPFCRIYDKALTAAEVLQNYNAQKGRFGL